MRVDILPQFQIGSVSTQRVGDYLNAAILDSACQQFRFVVAFMRMSGLDRLAASLDALVQRGGQIAGCVGVDEGVTTLEALESLATFAPQSVIFYSVSGFIFHPKLYLVNGTDHATAVMGSPNLTGSGLFRNVELATALHLDFHSSVDLEVYQRYDALLNELLNTAHPNIQPINATVLQTLLEAGVLGREATAEKPETRRHKQRMENTALRELFPPLPVPAAPPAPRRISSPPQLPSPPTRVVPATLGATHTFLMQLSAFDSSHRTGVKGTPEVLIPHEAAAFFPPIARNQHKYPDALFDVTLQTPVGPEICSYRFWYYEFRETGTRIDEYRLRMDRKTIDLSTVGGGDLLIIHQLPPDSRPRYEVYILPATDPTFPAFFSLCNRQVQGKHWGLVTRD